MLGGSRRGGSASLNNSSEGLQVRESLIHCRCRVRQGLRDEVLCRREGLISCFPFQRGEDFLSSWSAPISRVVVGLGSKGESVV